MCNVCDIKVTVHSNREVIFYFVLEATTIGTSIYCDKV